MHELNYKLQICFIFFPLREGSWRNCTNDAICNILNKFTIADAASRNFSFASEKTERVSQNILYLVSTFITRLHSRTLSTVPRRYGPPNVTRISQSAWD